jgi:glycerol uptake facilitator-like aquaporin
MLQATLTVCVYQVALISCRDNSSTLLAKAFTSCPVCSAGCFDRTVIDPKITNSQLFGWEVVMTFTLISVVYACGVAKPGHGSFTPLAVGLSLVACAGTGRHCL